MLGFGYSDQDHHQQRKLCLLEQFVHEVFIQSYTIGYPTLFFIVTYTTLLCFYTIIVLFDYFSNDTFLVIIVIIRWLVTSLSSWKCSRVVVSVGLGSCTIRALAVVLAVLVIVVVVVVVVAVVSVAVAVAAAVELRQPIPFCEDSVWLDPTKSTRSVIPSH